LCGTELAIQRLNHKKIVKLGRTLEDAGTSEPDEVAVPTRQIQREVSAARLRIALLTPYSGHNLGDAAIQDAIIANLRLRLPNVQFSGISLNCDNFAERHSPVSFPLCGTDRPFYGMCHGKLTDEAQDRGKSEQSLPEKRFSISAELKKALKHIPVFRWCLKKLRSAARSIGGELSHCGRAYKFLRQHNLLVVSGGGQLDEEWGGPWGHPFALAKWGVLARLARVPYAIVSVGACKVNSTTCRLFLSTALRMAPYRSYRDKNSRKLAVGMLEQAAGDPVVPDLAFTLPNTELPSTGGIRSVSRGRSIVAISPIAYARPGIWVYEDPLLYDRYVHELARVMSQLLHRDYFLVIVWSGVGDDDRVIPDILERLDDEARRRAAEQIHVPRIRTWKDFVVSLRDVDFLIASRLHGVILGFLTQTPSVAISFDPKVDWVMEDLCQTEFLLQIRDFMAEDVIAAFDQIELRKNAVVKQISSYLESILSVSNLQYDKLADLALENQGCRS
jgi:polysaccharide pyruvyl transferase WcaK-like protein